LINEYLKENSKEADEVMNEINEDILVCGHTHIPYFKYYGEKLLVNGGSVGKPKTNNPDANYVIIDVKNHEENKVENSEVSVEIIEVTYDFEKTAKAIEESNLPDDFARLIRTGSAK
jgi:predicted phosphodiesterase